MKIQLAVCAALGATLAVVPAPARAEDQRPCVSTAEYHGVKLDSRRHLEERWEVVGRGAILRVPQYPKLTFYYYPACGFAEDQKAVYIAVRRSLHTVLEVYRTRAPGAGSHLHGHPRAIS